MNQQNATVQKTAQKHIAIYAERVRQQSANLYRDDAENRRFQAYLEATKVCDDHNVLPLIMRDFESEDDLPDIDVLVAIGKLNLEALLREQRRCFKRFKATQSALERFSNRLSEIATKISQDTDTSNTSLEQCKICSYDFPHQAGLFDYCEDCPLHRTFVTTSLAFFDKIHDGPPWPEGTRRQYDVEMSKVNPCGKPCLVYQNDRNSAQLMQQFIQNIQERRDYVKQQKHITLKYIQRIVTAKHDKRLKVLPLFACFRTEEYLQYKEVFLIFRQSSLEFRNKNCYEHGFHIYKLVPVTESRYFSSLIAIDESDNLYDYDDEKIRAKFSSINTISKRINLIYPDKIEQSLPIVIKPWEVLALHNNPEYAKIWAYSNRIGRTEPLMIKLFLTSVKLLKPVNIITESKEP